MAQSEAEERFKRKRDEYMRKRRAMGLDPEELEPVGGPLGRIIKMKKAPCVECGKQVTVPRFIRRPLCDHCLAEQQETERRQEEAERELRRQDAEAARLAAERDRQLTVDRIVSDMPGVLAHVGVPERHQEASLDACPDLPSKLVAKARCWAAKPSGILFLSGPPGAGKTYVAVGILRAVLVGLIGQPLSDKCRTSDDARIELSSRAESGCGFISEREYLEARRPTSDGPSGNSRPWSCYAQFLTIDDFAATRLTPWGKDEMAGLIEDRYRKSLPTAITSNLDLNQIASAIDARIASRIAESRQVWTFPACDLRLAGSIRDS